MFLVRSRETEALFEKGRSHAVSLGVAGLARPIRTRLNP